MKPIPDVCPAVDAADTELAKKVQHLLIASRGGYRWVNVQAEAGTVRLLGPVRSFFLRQLAVVLAKQVIGVRNVIDQLEVEREQIDSQQKDES